MCGTEGRLVARGGGDLRGTKRGGREQLILLEMEDQEEPSANDNFSPCLSRYCTWYGVQAVKGAVSRECANS